MDSNRVVIPGGSGQLGRLLSRYFVRRGRPVVVLTRRPGAAEAGVTECLWDGETLGPWVAAIDGAAAVVNLAGRSVNCRYTRRHRREMTVSRIASTRLLGEAIAGCTTPPPVWLNSSTATIYKHSVDHPMTEWHGVIGATPEAKDALSVEIAAAWEREFFAAATPRTRRVALRTAIVLSNEAGNMLTILRRLARWGLGGAMAGGRQYVSWIHEADFCRAVDFLITGTELEGVVNVAAPGPVTNAELMRRVRAEQGRRFGLPAARWMLEVGAFFLRTETELVLKSRRAVPGRLKEAGFHFDFPTLADALSALAGGHAAAGAAAWAP
jgi:uncharacterized protein (TIGR01777 family)